MALLAPLGGVVADRYDRFRVLQICYAFATLQAAGLAALAVSGDLTIHWLAALAFLHGLIHAFSVPSQFGLLPRFVERSRLPSAIGVAAAYTQLGLFVGPALAGWVILHFGPAAAFASNVLGYGVYFASAARLRTPPGYRPPPPSKKSFARDFVDGVRTIAANRAIAGVLTLMLFGDALSAAVRQMMPAFADRGLHAGVAGLSAMFASAGIGATLSALWLAHGGVRRSTSRVIGWAFLGYLAATAMVMAASSLLVAAGAMVARGFCFEICRTGTIALLQTSVADTMRGRLMSTQFFLQQGASSLGVAIVGVVAQYWGLRAPILCGTALALLVWIMTLRERQPVATSTHGGGEAHAIEAD
jgi:MFS family permease